MCEIYWIFFFENPPSFLSELPDSGPVISGGLQNYRLGDRLELNCTSPKTYPPTTLKWLLNGREVNIKTKSEESSFYIHILKQSKSSPNVF
jgi:hypothetical protein